MLGCVSRDRLDLDQVEPGLAKRDVGPHGKYQCGQDSEKRFHHFAGLSFAAAGHGRDLFWPPALPSATFCL